MAIPQLGFNFVTPNRQIAHGEQGLPINASFGSGRYVSAPLGQDSVSFSSNPDNEQKKKSNAVKLGILLGVLGGIAGAAAIIRGKINKFKPVKFAEHIDFTPAKTIEEARAFAQKHFRIDPKDFKVEDLQIANYANQGFANAVNVCKGNIVLPNSIVAEGSNAVGMQAVSRGAFGKRILTINSGVMEPEKVFKMFTDIPEAVKKQYIEGDYLTRLRILTETYNNELVNKRDIFHNIYHELGHLNHKHQSPVAYAKWAEAGTGDDIVKTLDKSKPKGERLHPLIQKHIESLIDTQITDKTIGQYAIYYPNEFVAEMYAYFMKNQRQQLTVNSREQFAKLIALYEKYGGPKLGVL